MNKRQAHCAARAATSHIVQLFFDAGVLKRSACTGPIMREVRRVMICSIEEEILCFAGNVRAVEMLKARMCG